MVTTRPPKTIVKPTALGSVANTDTKLLIYGLFQKGRVLAQDGVSRFQHGTRIAESLGSSRTSIAGASKDLAWPLVRNFAVFDHGASVHEHVTNAN